MSENRVQTSLKVADGEFPDPFLDIASMVLPSSHKSLMDMCTMMWLKNGTYRNAVQRIVRYFITDIDMTSHSETERQAVKEFLEVNFDMNLQAGLVGDDWLAYGVSMTSINFPFNRFLRCGKCHRETFIDNLSWNYSQEGKFSGTCGCGFTAPMTVVDRKCLDRDRITNHRWNPYNMLLQKHPLSNRTKIYWDIPPDIRNKVKSNDQFMIRDMPLEMLNTISKDAIFGFHPDYVHLLTQDTVAGIETNGWGLPRLVSNFSQAYYNQLMKRSAEALAQDYIVPFRVVSPSPASGVGKVANNPYTNFDMGAVNANVAGMIEEHRHKLSTWHFSPIPLQYQSMSGEGTMITPQLLDQGTNQLLADMGVNPELYSGNLGMQAAPMALRTLQQSWPGLITGLNKWLKFSVDRICKHMNWDTPNSVSFKKVTLSDDIERRQLLLQLAASNMISKQTAYGVWGIDPKDEQDKILEEMKEQQEQQVTFEEDMMARQETQQMLAQGGMMPQGAVGDPNAMAGATGGPIAMPAGGGAAGGMVTPMDKVSEAQTMAAELVRMPEAERKQQLRQLKRSDEVSHALVKQYMSEERTAARSQGSAMLASGQM